MGFITPKDAVKKVKNKMKMLIEILNLIHQSIIYHELKN